MKVGLAQIDPAVGDLEGNEARIASAIREAASQGAELIVLPELCSTGYPPRDLLLDEEFVRRTLRATSRLAQVAPDVPVVLGTIERGGPGRLRNVAVLLRGGRVEASRAKALLPVDDVFNEPRYFEPGERAAPLLIAGRRVGLLVCEDLWDERYARSPARDLVRDGADLLVCINASPFRVGVLAERLRLARRPGVELIYVNAVGGQDDLVFDGSSFALDRDGGVLAALPLCRERVAVVELGGPPVSEPLQEATPRQAIVLGVRDFVRKNQLPGAVVGVSGGVDSALVACLAAEAIGPRLRAVHVPSRYTSARSTEDCRALCDALGLELDVLPLEPLHVAVEATLSALAGGAGGSVMENAQARLRGMLLMAWVNHAGGVLLNTSNKTELALGYGTLYGDMAGGLGVIADLTKTEVYRIAREAYGDVIPSHVLERPPSAELAHDQVDPFDYPHIAPLVERVIQGDSLSELRSLGASSEEVRWIELRLRAAEFKRYQSPPGIKVSRRAFGSGRQVPLTHGFERVRAAAVTSV